MSGDVQGARVKVYELPLWSSMYFIAIAGGAWTALAVIVRLGWKRRVSREGDEAGGPQVETSNAPMAAHEA